MITATSKLQINDTDKLILDQLCRHYTSCMHTAFNRLIEDKNYYSKEKRKINENYLSNLFNLNAAQVRDAICEAEALIESCYALKKDPKKVIFGSKKLFKKLQKKHLSEKQREEIKLKFKETRKYRLYATGDSRGEGNLNLRIININNENLLKINVGPYKWIYAKIITHHKKWNQLLKAKKYTVKLTRKDNVYYASFSFDEQFDYIKQIIGFKNGAIGVDLNASPSNIAWCEIKDDGNYVNSGTIPTPILYDCSSNKRTHYCWIYAKEIVDIALRTGKAIVLENLKNIGNLNRVISNFCRSKLHNCIEIVAMRSGVQCVTVWSAYTSIIGCVKYSPIYNLSRHESAAMVIARRGLVQSKGKKHVEKVPKCYFEDKLIQKELEKPKKIKKAKKKRKKKVKKDKLPVDKKADKVGQNLISDANTVNFTLWKKGVGSNLEKFRLINMVYKKAVLTGQTTMTIKRNLPKSKRKVKKRTVLPNWSILKKKLIHNQLIFESNCSLLENQK